MTARRISASDGSAGATSVTFGIQHLVGSAAAVTAGNLLLVAAIGLPGWTAPSGFTSIIGQNSNNYRAELYAKIADGSEGTVAIGAGGTVTAMACCEYAGMRNPYLLDGTAGGTTTGGNGTSLATASISPQFRNGLVFTVCLNATGVSPAWTRATMILSAENATGGLYCGERVDLNDQQSPYSDTCAQGASGQMVALIAGFAPDRPNLPGNIGSSFRAGALSMSGQAF